MRIFVAIVGKFHTKLVPARFSIGNAGFVFALLAMTKIINNLGILNNSTEIVNLRLLEVKHCYYKSYTSQLPCCKLKRK